MYKDEFLKEIANRTDSTVIQAQKYLSAIEDIVMTAIALEDKVHFSFGTIGGKTKAPRVQRMPNGEIVHVPEKKGQPYYKPSKIAKDY